MLNKSSSIMTNGNILLRKTDIETVPSCQVLTKAFLKTNKTDLDFNYLSLAPITIHYSIAGLRKA